MKKCDLVHSTEDGIEGLNEELIIKIVYFADLVEECVGIKALISVNQVY
jgi:hypothetical protein